MFSKSFHRFLTMKAIRGREPMRWEFARWNLTQAWHLEVINLNSYVFKLVWCLYHQCTIFTKVIIVSLIREIFDSCFLILSPALKWIFNTGANSTLEPKWQWLCDGWVSAFGSKKNYLCWRSSTAPPSWWVEENCRAVAGDFRSSSKDEKRDILHVKEQKYFQKS